MNKSIPILLYHNIVTKTDPSAPDWISVDSFKSQMTYIVKQGYTPITPDLLLTKNLLPKKPILITFDDGYENVYHHAFPILKELNISFTVFLISSFISDETQKKGNTWNTGWRPFTYHLSKEMIRNMLDSNLLSIGSHTLSHQMFCDIIAEEIEEEVTSSVRFLSSSFNRPISTFSYPGGYIGNPKITYSILQKNGIQLAFGGQIDQLEHLDKINYFNVKRINITNEVTFIGNKVKYRFDGILHPTLSNFTKYNKLNFIMKRILPPYYE